MHTNLSKCVLVLVSIIGMTSFGLAQRTTATFAGIVTDLSSAVLPGASVQLINEGTNAVTEKVTGETGEFLFDYVPVGTYTLKISLPGFKTYESRAIPLGAAQSTIVRLVVGEGLQLAAAGAAIGLVVAVAATRLLVGLVVGVEPQDPVTFAAVTFVLVAATLLAMPFKPMAFPRARMPFETRAVPTGW